MIRCRNCNQEVDDIMSHVITEGFMCRRPDTLTRTINSATTLADLSAILEMLEHPLLTAMLAADGQIHVIAHLPALGSFSGKGETLPIALHKALTALADALRAGADVCGYCGRVRADHPVTFTMPPMACSGGPWTAGEWDGSPFSPSPDNPRNKGG